MKIRLIIAGSREFNDYALLRRCVNRYLHKIGIKQPFKDAIIVVSGEARGADRLGERFAKNRGIEIKPFPYVRSAGTAGGPIRNRQMAEYATHCILFWDGKSSGTANMMSEARRVGIKPEVIVYKEKSK